MYILTCIQTCTQSFSCYWRVPCLLRFQRLLAVLYSSRYKVAGRAKLSKHLAGLCPYPICFELQDNNTLYGVADLHVSRHHWRFYLVEDMEQLSFLSTFAGNETPLYLSASQVASDHIAFSTEDGQYLQVQVQQQKKGYRFTIKVKGKEHVIIQLVQEGGK